MTEQLADASIRAYSHWNQIPWETVEQSVRRLQTRIAKAVLGKNYRKVNALQWILTHSYHAKLLAIRRVTTNRGKNTPGVDGVVWKSARRKMTAVNSLRRKGYAPQPLRRVYIPKKNGKKRPLSIPTMYDRAMQALYKMALDPVAETTADPNSYGFRPYRRCADAIGQCYIALAKKISPTWILRRHRGALRAGPDPRGGAGRLCRRAPGVRLQRQGHGQSGLKKLEPQRVQRTRSGLVANVLMHGDDNIPATGLTKATQQYLCVLRGE